MGNPCYNSGINKLC